MEPEISLPVHIENMSQLISLADEAIGKAARIKGIEDFFFYVTEHKELFWDVQGFMHARCFPVILNKLCQLAEEEKMYKDKSARHLDILFLGNAVPVNVKESQHISSGIRERIQNLLGSNEVEM